MLKRKRIMIAKSKFVVTSAINWLHFRTWLSFSSSGWWTECVSTNPTTLMKFMAYRDQKTNHKTLKNLLMYEIYLPKTKNNNNTQSKQKHIAQTYDLLVPFSYRFECQKLVLVGDPKVSVFLRVILLTGHPFLLNFSSKHLNCFPLFRLCFPFL